jgi:inorganic pyrophosphatase
VDVTVTCGSCPDHRPAANPADWCYFPDTLVEGGGPLGAIVCASRPGSSGDRIEVRPIALLRFRGRQSYREIVLCVPFGDMSWTGIELVGDLPLRLRRDLEQFVSLDQSGDRVPSGVAWCSRTRALSAIDNAAARWAATANGRG